MQSLPRARDSRVHRDGRMGPARLLSANQQVESEPLKVSAKINLAQQNQASTLPIAAVFAHPMPVTPHVKSGKMRVSSFNHALASVRFGKSADPTCYNVCVGGNRASDRLFDIVRTA